MKSIKTAVLNDLAVIRDLAYAIWPSAYGDILSPGQLQYMLDKIYSLSSLQNQLLNLHHNFIIVLDNDIPGWFCIILTKGRKQVSFSSP